MEAAHLHVYGTGPLFFVYSVSESVVCCSIGFAPSYFQCASSSTILTPSLSRAQFLKCNTTVGLEKIHAVFEGAFPMASNRRWWDRYLDVRTMEIRSGHAYLAFAQELQRTLSILTEVHHWAGFKCDIHDLSTGLCEEFSSLTSAANHVGITSQNVGKALRRGSLVKSSYAITSRGGDISDKALASYDRLKQKRSRNTAV